MSPRKQTGSGNRRKLEVPRLASFALPYNPEHPGTAWVVRLWSCDSDTLCRVGKTRAMCAPNQSPNAGHTHLGTVTCSRVKDL